MNKGNETGPVYREVQHFRQIWIWAIVLSLAGFMWYGLVKQILLNSPFGNKPMPDFPLIILWLIFGIGLPALFLFGKLVTEVRDDGIYIRFSPFHWSFHKIAFKELRRCEVRTYHPIRDYGGWGIRFGAKGKAYNVSGNRGVQVEFLNGKSLLIGSQRAEELWGAIQKSYNEQQGK